MRALTSLPEPPFVSMTEIDDPSPSASQALVDVRAVSLNRGESRRLATYPAGTLTGWDVAGVIAQPAADGSGPPAGARVVGLTQTGWAERAAIDAELLAPLPDAVSFEQASTLPVAGLTALFALEHGGFLLGRRVLVTGASGGVGRFAIQLAKLGGAHVTALARRTGGLAELGADEVITELSAPGEDFHLIVEGVGGEVLGQAIQRVGGYGTIVNYASTTGDPTSFPTRELFGRASGARLIGMLIFVELAHNRRGRHDLRRLAELVADRRLDCQIARIDPWENAGQAIAALLDRQVDGKAVLTIG